jgi:hypothetical protein
MSRNAVSCEHLAILPRFDGVSLPSKPTANPWVVRFRRGNSTLAQMTPAPGNGWPAVEFEKMLDHPSPCAGRWLDQPDLTPC